MQVFSFFKQYRQPEKTKKDIMEAIDQYRALDVVTESFGMFLSCTYFITIVILYSLLTVIL